MEGFWKINLNFFLWNFKILFDTQVLLLNLAWLILFFSKNFTKNFKINLKFLEILKNKFEFFLWNFEISFDTQDLLLSLACSINSKFFQKYHKKILEGFWKIIFFCEISKFHLTHNFFYKSCLINSDFIQTIFTFW